MLLALPLTARCRQSARETARCGVTAGLPALPACPALLIPGTKSAHQIDDQCNQENQAERSPTDGRAAEIKAAAAKQEEENDEEDE